MLQRLKMSIEERKHLHSLQESVRPEIPGTCFATSLLSGGGTEYVCRVLCLQAISSLEGEVKELELQSSHALDAVLSADRLFFLIPFLCCLFQHLILPHFLWSGQVLLLPDFHSVLGEIRRHGTSNLL